MSYCRLAWGGGARNLGLNGKVALVTAASRGLGRAVATELARESAQVVIASRSQEALARTATEIGKETGVEVGYFAANLSAGDLKALASQVAERLRGLHLSP